MSESELDRDLLSEIDRFYVAIGAPDRGWVPASEAELDVASDQLGMALPEDLRSLYRLTPGGDCLLLDVLEPRALASTRQVFLEQDLAEYEEFEVPHGAGLGSAPEGTVVPFAGLGSVFLCLQTDGPGAGQLFIGDAKGSLFWEPGAFWEWVAPSILAWASASADLAEAGLVRLLESMYWRNGRPRAVLTDVSNVHSTCLSYEAIQVLDRAGVGSGILGLGTRDPACPHEPCVSYPNRLRAGQP